jgi:DNA-directed RNA polymerase subunit K/omega
MIDNPTAQAKVGNIFDLVLIASERVRELNRERAASGLNSLPTSEYKKLPKLHHQAIDDIEQGRVGREYLKKISDRANRGRRDKDYMR